MYAFDKLETLHDSNARVREMVQHNLTILRRIRGGLGMAVAHRYSFDPRGEYWLRPERRLAVAWLAKRWTGEFDDPIPLRDAALALCQYLDQARAAGAITYTGLDYEAQVGMAELKRQFTEWLGRWTPPRFFRDSKFRGQPAVADLLSFVTTLTADDWQEESFGQRVPWFGYLGTTSLEQVRARQSFFYGYQCLWTSTNSYHQGGAQTFASNLQNTHTEAMLAPALAWSRGESPRTARLLVFGKNIATQKPKDKSESSVALETLGFLTLERAPFYNQAAETYRKAFGVLSSLQPLDMMSEVARQGARWLSENPARTASLAKVFRTWSAQPLPRRDVIETVVPAPATLPTTTFDSDFHRELEGAANQALGALDDAASARLALHLLLDAQLYVAGESATTTAAAEIKPPPPPPSPTVVVPATRRLPAALERHGNRALRYLHAGLHVVFAGAPGTGKTTLAQFVGAAWNEGLTELPFEITEARAPTTTVGNSAWSPLHTVGGLMPAEDGRFTAQPGIFIDPSSTGAKTWRLRSAAIVLDEMNRADLDRCMGELYPLLSGSVAQVEPAGLPNVGAITSSPRFRVLATINDATVDDIVFPISEGLARRFQRIDLHGASKDELLTFLGLEDIDASDVRRSSALRAIEHLFFLARSEEFRMTATIADVELLPIGVGYFELFRKWVLGELNLPGRSYADEDDNAGEWLAASLRSLTRSRKWPALLSRLETL